MSTTSPSNDTLLQVKNLSHHFHMRKHTVKAVDEIDFELYPGETLGIVGESGSGKSVTALSLMRLLSIPPRLRHLGEILFHSHVHGHTDLRKLSEDAIRKVRGAEIGMVFQDSSQAMNPVFSCGNHVMEAILTHQRIDYDEAREKVIELFDKVKLKDPEGKFKAYPHQLSGGELQRVMIAIAIACQPRLLIADEPTTALDVTIQAHIIKWLRQYKEESNLSMIFISHDLNLMAEVADRVLIMRNGRIVEQGTVDEIFRRPKLPYTQGLLACRPRPELDQKYLPVLSDFREMGNAKVDTLIKRGLRPVGERKKRRDLLDAQPTVLEVEDLRVWFPKKRGFLQKSTEFTKAVDGVSFAVRQGETLGLVGESGSGKTTLFRTIARLEEYSSGKILFEGRDIGNLNKKDLRHLRSEMQMIFQNASQALNPQMAVGDILQEPLVIHKMCRSAAERQDRVMELLDQVGLDYELMSRMPGELSGGQRQRVTIARALAVKPRFLICDESVSALDVGIQAQILNLLNKLKEEYNFTLIFVSHDLSVVKFIADRIIVLREGKIVETGYAEEIYQDPKDDYTRELIQAIPKGLTHS